MENVWGASPALNSSMTVMKQQFVQAAPHLGHSGSPTILMCYSVASQTPLFLGKSDLVAGINIHWLIDWQWGQFGGVQIVCSRHHHPDPIRISLFAGFSFSQMHSNTMPTECLAIQICNVDPIQSLLAGFNGERKEVAPPPGLSFGSLN